MIIQLPYIIEFPSCSQASLTKDQLPKYCLMCNPNYAPKIFLQNSIKTKKFVKNRKTRKNFELQLSQNRAFDYKYLKIELHISNKIYTLSRIRGGMTARIWKSSSATILFTGKKNRSTLTTPFKLHFKWKDWPKIKAKANLGSIKNSSQAGNLCSSINIQYETLIKIDRFKRKQKGQICRCLHETLFIIHVLFWT